MNSADQLLACTCVCVDGWSVRLPRRDVVHVGPCLVRARAMRHGMLRAARKARVDTGRAPRVVTTWTRASVPLSLTRAVHTHLHIYIHT